MHRIVLLLVPLSLWPCDTTLVPGHTDPSPDAARARALIESGKLCDQQGDHHRAEALFRSAVAILDSLNDPPHDLHVVGLENLAISLRRQRRLAESVEIHRRALTLAESNQSTERPILGAVLHNLAMAYLETGRRNEAETLFLRSAKVNEACCSSGDRYAIGSLAQLGSIYLWKGEHAKAEQTLRTALRNAERSLGADSVEVAVVLNYVARLQYEANDLSSAERNWKRAIAIFDSLQRRRHSDVALSLVNLGVNLASLGELKRFQRRYDEAEAYLKRAVHILETNAGPGSVDLAHGLNNLGLVYADRRQDDQATLMYRRCIAILERTIGPEAPQLPMVLRNLAASLAGQQAYREAEQLYLRALAIIEKVEGPQHRAVADTLSEYAGLLRSLKRGREVAGIQERIAAIRKLHPPISLHTIDVREIGR